MIRGEGEETLQELTVNFHKDKYANIDGLYTKEYKGKIRVIENLRKTPSPYLESVFNLKKYHIFAFQTHRGCVNRCRFCQWQYPGKIRYLPIIQIINELKFLSSIKNLYILQCIDADFFANKKTAVKILTKMITEKITFPQINYEVNYLNLDNENLEKLKKTGETIILAFGLESSSEKVLNSVNKPINLNLFKKQVSKAKKHGLLIQINMLIGLPNQTWDTLEKTIQYIKTLHPDRVVVNPLYLTDKEKILKNTKGFAALPIDKLKKIQIKIIEILKNEIH
ncbi:MAG: B12-binding domain-containing radical SAM protein [Candidatus Odinarchaeia archaeon]